MIITIDGVDGVGKKTTIEALKERLEETGDHVYMMDFPQYDKPGGMAVRQYLTDTNMVSAYRDPINMVYQNDRNLFMMGVSKDAELAHATAILYNRSWISNMIFQTAEHPVEKNALLDDERIYRAPVTDRIAYLAAHIIHAYYREIKPWSIPVAGLASHYPLSEIKQVYNIVLTANRDIIDRNIEKRGDSESHVKDLNEKDLNFLDSVTENIAFIASHWVHIHRAIENILIDAKYNQRLSSLLFEPYAFMEKSDRNIEIAGDFGSIERFFHFEPICVHDSEGNQYSTNEIINMIESVIMNWD